jgi:hypothetical protein
MAGDLRIRPVRVSTNSEPLLDEDRQAIREAWDAPIHNLWGSTEIGVQAVGCGRDEGLHICEDEVVLERVDDSGKPVGPDEPAARTLATGLSNRTFPFIRYDLGDQVMSLAGECACGSAFARVADIGGRRDDDFRYEATTVPAIAFRHVLGTDPRVSEYQVAQNRHRGRHLRRRRSGPRRSDLRADRRTAQVWVVGADDPDPGSRCSAAPPGQRQDAAVHPSSLGVLAKVVDAGGVVAGNEIDHPHGIGFAPFAAVDKSLQNKVNTVAPQCRAEKVQFRRTEPV